MPWRGPNEDGEFPTLGYDMGEWIERVEVHPDRVVLWMYQPDEPGNKSPRPFGRGLRAGKRKAAFRRLGVTL